MKKSLLAKIIAVVTIATILGVAGKQLASTQTLEIISKFLGTFLRAPVDKTPVFDYTASNLKEIKNRIENQTSQQTATEINAIPTARAAQILSYEPILKISGQIWLVLDKEKASQIWNTIQTQDEQGEKTEWNSSLLTTHKKWNNATIKHFRHWIKHNPKMITQHVTQNNINRFLLALIGNMKTTSLDLSNKGLSLLPPTINQLTGLQELSLGFEDFETYDIMTFSALRYNLNVNKLTTLEDNIFNGLTGLKKLSLSGNKLTTLGGNVFNGLTELQTLDLGYNKLTALGDHVFNGLTGLTKFGFEEQQPHNLRR